MSTIGIPVVLAPTLGTTLGSVMLEHLGWAWLFWIDTPLCVAAVVAGLRWLPRLRSGDAGGFDWLGMTFVVGGLSLFIYGVSAVGDAGGLHSAGADAFTAIGICLLGAFAVYARRMPAPLVRVRLFANRVFQVSEPSRSSPASSTSARRSSCRSTSSTRAARACSTRGC